MNVADRVYYQRQNADARLFIRVGAADSPQNLGQQFRSAARLDLVFGDLRHLIGRSLKGCRTV